MKKIVHVGFPKTATTTLQNAMKKMNNVSYLGYGLRNTMEPSLSLDIARAVFFADEIRFEEQAEKIREKIDIESTGSDAVFLSDEAFTFSEYMKIGFYWERHAITDHREISRRIGVLMPDSEILICLRNQLSLIKSFYCQSVKVNHVSETFESYVDREISAVGMRSMINTLKYDEVYEAYTSVFGDDGVHVLLFEDYKGDMEGYLRSVARISGIDAGDLLAAWGGKHDNKAPEILPSPTTDMLKKYTPKWIKMMATSGMKSNIISMFGREVPAAVFRGDQAEFLKKQFRDSNLRFKKLTGMSLPSVYE